MTDFDLLIVVLHGMWWVIVAILVVFVFAVEIIMTAFNGSEE